MAAGVRPLADGEVGAFARSVSVPFLDPGNHEAETYWAPHLELDRAWVVEDRGRFVGNACVFTRDITVPGAPGDHCPLVPFAAVSGVGVHPTHRRRGLMRALMTTMLEDARARGEAIAGLLASESTIYGRFGFGLASSVAELIIETRHRAMRPDLVPADIDIELLDPDGASKLIPALHDELRRRRAGEVQRNDATWAHIFADSPSTRGGMSARMYALTDGGFAAYRGQERDSGPGGRGRLEVRDLYGATPEIEAALWRFLLDIDLVDEVAAFPRPLDEPLRWRLAEPRALRTTKITDFIWIRVLDTAAALTARGYAHPGRLVIDVLPVDAGGDPAVGRWVLEAGPDGAICVPATPDDVTDLSLGLADLGSLYLGGVAASVLAAAGRAREERAGALHVADRLFTSTPTPFSGTGF